MAPNIILLPNKVNTNKIANTNTRMMNENDDCEDIELGEITVGSTDETDSLHLNSIHQHVSQKMIYNGTDDDAQSSSQSGLWGSSGNSGNSEYTNDMDQSTSNDTGISPTTTNQHSTQSRDMSEESYNIAKIENLAVMTWRLIMFGVLILTTFGAAIVVRSR